MRPQRYATLASLMETEEHDDRWQREAFDRVCPDVYRQVKLAQLHPKEDRLRPTPNTDHLYWRSVWRSCHHYGEMLDRNSEGRQKLRQQSRR